MKNNKKTIAVFLVITVLIMSLVIGCWGNLTESIGKDVLAELGGKDIEISVGSTIIASESGEYTFPGKTLIDGNAGTGVSGQTIFTITNSGDLDINSIAVGILSGLNTGDFDLDTTGLLDSLAPGESTSFTIQFDPLEDAGILSADIFVTTRETDNLSFTVNGVADWWGIETIQSTNNVGSFTSLAVDGNDVYIVFVEEPDDNPYSFATENLYMTVSENQGKAWGSPQLIEDSPSFAYFQPSIAVADGTAYVSYLQLEQGGNEDLKFAKSSNRGLNWMNMQTIILDEYFSQGWNSDIKVVGGTVYIASYDAGFLGENMGLLFVRSDNGGTTFEGVTNGFNAYTLEYVDWDDATPIDDPIGMFPSMAVSGSRVYIGYFVQGLNEIPTDQVRVAVSIDNGETWDPSDGTNPAIKEIVDTPEYAYDESSTDIAVNGSTVYFMYTDGSGTTQKLMFARSDDSGATWPAGNIKMIDTITNIYSYAGMAVSGNNVYVAYYTYGTWNLMFNKSTDGGTTWPATGVTIDNDTDVGGFVDIAAVGDNVYISYYDWDVGELKFAKSIDGGVTW